MVRVWIKAFFAENDVERPPPSQIEPISIPERAGAFLLLGTTVLIGLWPGLLLNLITPTLQFAPVPTALERRPAMNSSLDWMMPLVPEEHCDCDSRWWR